MFKLITMIVAGALSVSGSSIAGDCAHAENALAIVDCHVARYEAADKALNSTYKEAMKSLSDTEKKKLQDAQKAWLKYRDASFAFVVEANKEAQSYGNVVIENYKATLVEKRVLELEYILSGPEDAPVEW